MVSWYSQGLINSCHAYDLFRRTQLQWISCSSSDCSWWGLRGWYRHKRSLDSVLGGGVSKIHIFPIYSQYGPNPLMLLQCPDHLATCTFKQGVVSIEDVIRRFEHEYNILFCRYNFEFLSLLEHTCAILTPIEEGGYTCSYYTYNTCNNLIQGILDISYRHWL